ncbi:MAG TPA: hypothetical protein VJH03_01760 [Blastocatellia bacterium]|nr:hypothetical protein [Blastocatellia bacterium]
MPTRDQLVGAVAAACKELEDRDEVLFVVNANERSLSHKFAMYLQEEVEAWGEDWDVDCEYNRNADTVNAPYKKLLDIACTRGQGTTKLDDEHAKTVFPDVIVHRRRTPDNLLVVELKKTTARTNDKDFDIEKLRAYVDQLRYRAAAFILLDVKTARCEVEWVPPLVDDVVDSR